MSISSFFKNIQRERRIKKAGLQFPIFTRAHGVKNPDYQGALAQSADGDELQVVHLPLPDYPHNTYLYSIPLNRIIGYVEKEIAEKLVFAFGEGFCLDGEIYDLVGGYPYKYWGCRIFIYDDKTMMENQEFAHLHE